MFNFLIYANAEKRFLVALDFICGIVHYIFLGIETISDEFYQLSLSVPFRPLNVSVVVSKVLCWYFVYQLHDSVPMCNEMSPFDIFIAVLFIQSTEIMSHLRINTFFSFFTPHTMASSERNMLCFHWFIELPLVLA